MQRWFPLLPGAPLQERPPWGLKGGPGKPCEQHCQAQAVLAQLREQLGTDRFLDMMHLRLVMVWGVVGGGSSVCVGWRGGGQQLCRCFSVLYQPTVSWQGHAFARRGALGGGLQYCRWVGSWTQTGASCADSAEGAAGD